MGVKQNYCFSLCASDNTDGHGLLSNEKRVKVIRKVSIEFLRYDKGLISFDIIVFIVMLFYHKMDKRSYIVFKMAFSQ